MRKRETAGGKTEYAPYLDKAKYDENGFLHIPSVLQRPKVSEIREGILEILRHDKEKKSGQELFERSNRYRRFSLHLHLRNKAIYAYVRHEVFESIGLTLIGDDVDLHFTSTLTKSGEKSAGVDMHQDMIYESRKDESRLLCWTSVTPSYPENGGLFVVPGSHKNGPVPHAPSDSYERDFQAIGFSLKDAVPVRMAAGDILVIHPFLVHGSPENRTSQERVALIAGYQKPGVYTEPESKLRVEILRDGEPSDSAQA